MIDHEKFMRLAYQEALKAMDEGEVPVGAIIVDEGGKLRAKGHNSMERLKDATAHAEILAIGAASSNAESWRLNDCTLYVTLEPCLMCLGAILNSRIPNIVYGTADKRLGAVDTFCHRNLIEESYHKFPNVISGIMQNECEGLLKSFFKNLRKKC